MQDPSEAGVLAEIERLQRELYELRQRLGGRARTPLPETAFDVLSCGLGGHRVAFPLTAVAEVLPIARLTPLPESPVWIRGLLTLRGETLPVLDVSARIARQYRDIELSDLVIVTEREPARLGLVVQQVFGIETLEPAELRPPEKDIPQAPYLAGVYGSSETPLFLIDLRRLVEASEIPEDTR